MQQFGLMAVGVVLALHSISHKVCCIKIIMWSPEKQEKEIIHAQWGVKPQLVDM
jgi:hypothetical protein